LLLFAAPMGCAMKPRRNIFPSTVEVRTLPHDKSGVLSIVTLGRLWVNRVDST
jgi:hypothetical protein